MTIQYKKQKLNPRGCIILFSLILIMAVFSASVFAWDFDNSKSYDSRTSTITVTNTFGLGGKIADIQLLTPHVNLVIPGSDRLVAEMRFNITDLSYTNPFKAMSFYDLNSKSAEISKSFTYKYKYKSGERKIPIYKETCVPDAKEKNGTKCTKEIADYEIHDIYDWKNFDDTDLTTLPGKEVTIGLFADVGRNDKVEWQPTLFGIKIDEFASWTASFNVDLIAYYPFDNETDIIGSNDLVSGLAICGTGNDEVCATLYYNNSNAKHGNAGQFQRISNSNGTIVKINGNTDVNFTGDFTYNVWVRMSDATLANTEYFFNRGDGYQYGLGDEDGAGQLSMVRYWFGSSWLEAGHSIVFGDWEMWTVTLKNATNNLTFYFNGVPIVSGTDGHTGDNPSWNTYIGGRYLATTQFCLRGQLDEMMYWNRELSPAEVSTLWDGGTGTFYSAAPVAPVITLLNQTPSVITTNNIYSSKLNITYNITSTVGLNTSSVFYYSKTNSTLDEIWQYINGTQTIEGYLPIVGGGVHRVGVNISNKSDQWNFMVSSSLIYPSTFNLDPEVTGLVNKSYYTLSAPTDYIKIKIFNMTNNSYGVFNFMANSTAAAPDLRIYFCNESYTTGTLGSNPNCALIQNYPATQTFNYSISPTSYYNFIPFIMNTSTKTIAGIKVTDVNYFALRGRAVPAGTWYVYYVPEVARPDTIQNTSSGGTTWDNFSGTVNAFVSQYSPTIYSNFYYICANGTTGAGACSTEEMNTIVEGNQAPTPPRVYSPTNDTYYYGNLSINYTASESYVGVSFYNISLLNPDRTYNKTIYGNNSLNLSYRWDTTGTPNGNYVIRVEAVDFNTLSNFGYSEEFVLSSKKYILNLTSPVFEGQTNRIYFNLTALPNITSTNATLNYNNTKHVMTNSFTNLTSANFYADVIAPNFTLDGYIDQVNLSVNVSYYLNGISYNTANMLQEDHTFLLGICSPTAPTNVIPYVNFTFKDEVTGAAINGSFNNLEWDYGFGTNTKHLTRADTINYSNYTFCFIPQYRQETNNITIQYSLSGYPQRTWKFNGDYTNSTTQQVLFLLANTDGIYTTIIVQNSAGAAISSATVLFERTISSEKTQMEANTDTSGATTFWVNPNYYYNVTITKSGYNTAAFSLRPTQSQYTYFLTSGTNASYNSTLDGISFTTSPKPGMLNRNTSYIFGFNITSSKGNLVNYSMKLYYNNYTLYNQTSGTSSIGGNLSLTQNTNDYYVIIGRYYIDIGDGEYLIDPIPWPVENITAGDGSIYKAITDALLYRTDNIGDQYGYLWWFFFILFVSLSAFCYYTGAELTNPGVILFVVMGAVWVFSFMGWFDLNFVDASKPYAEFITKYTVALTSTFFAVGFAFGKLKQT